MGEPHAKVELSRRQTEVLIKAAKGAVFTEHTGALRHAIKKLEVALVALDTPTPIMGDFVDQYPSSGTLCSVCKEPQYEAPGGACCKNGHGGAPSAESGED